MHEMQTILTDVCSVCLSVRLSVTWLKSGVAHAVYTACRVHGVIRCSLCQITLTTCLFTTDDSVLSIAVQTLMLLMMTTTMTQIHDFSCEMLA